jgi:hypothetical protein
MLQVDLTKTDIQICRIIADKCTPFGAVTSVNIYRSPTPYAVVRMENRKHASVLARKFGKSTYDGTVIIPLKRK